MKKLINKAKILVFGEAATGEKIVSPCGIRTVMPDVQLEFFKWISNYHVGKEFEGIYQYKVSKATWGL